MKSMVYINAYNAPKIDKKEVLRYAGICTENAEANALLDRCILEMGESFVYKICYCRFPLNVEGEMVDLGFKSIYSHSLSLCLRECDEVIVFCATVGVEIDRLIKKYSIISPSVAVMLQALGSERVEALCDKFCAEIAAEEAKGGRKIRPRFSPGYGDLPLELQRDIFCALDPAKKIGVSLGENMFMSPSKSVTAIIGIKKER